MEYLGLIAIVFVIYLIIAKSPITLAGMCCGNKDNEADVADVDSDPDTPDTTDQQS